MINSRDKILDIMKGVAIILVIFGHQLVSMDEGNIILDVIYSFHIPLFFVISGYLVGKTVIGDSKQWISKKFFHLVIPWSLFTFYSFFLQKDYSFSQWLGFGFIYNQLAWFLWTLFTCYIIILLVNMIYIKYPDRALFLSLLLVVLFLVCPFINIVDNNNYLGKNVISWFFSFFFLGYMISKYNIWLSKINQKIIYLLGTLGFVVVMQLTNWDGGWLNQSFLPTSSYIFGNQWILIGRYLQALTGCCLAYTISKVIYIIPKTSDWIAWIGTKTLGIYLLTSVTVAIFPWTITVDDGWTKIITSSIFLGAATILIVMFVEQFYFLSALLIGDNKGWKKILGGER